MESSDLEEGRAIAAYVWCAFILCEIETDKLRPLTVSKG